MGPFQLAVSVVLNSRPQGGREFDNFVGNKIGRSSGFCESARRAKARTA